MKVIIAGSRDITDYEVVLAAVREAHNESGITATEIVSGCARGVDRLGEQIARNYGLRLSGYPADWERYGKSAGYRRNAEMADYADALVAVWDGKSRGTMHMINLAREKGLRVHVYLHTETQ